MLLLMCMCHVEPMFSAKCKLYRSRAMLKCTTKKRQLWQRLKAYLCNSLACIKYRDFVHEWRNLAQQQKNKEMTIQNQIIAADNVGHFYKFINRRIPNRNTIGAICNANGESYLAIFPLPMPLIIILHPWVLILIVSPLMSMSAMSRSTLVILTSWLLLKKTRD
jgi:hypothetical protein